MHDAYIVYPPEKISVQIESMTGFGKFRGSWKPTRPLHRR